MKLGARSAGVLVIAATLPASCRTPIPLQAGGQAGQASAVTPAAKAGGYAVSVDDWHRARIDRLRKEDGWLSLVGLHWLEEGDNTIGSLPRHTVANERLPVRDAGVIRLERGTVTLTPARGVTIGGLPEDGVLRTDADGSPTVLTIGTCRFHVLRRGDRYGVRLKDTQSPVRTTFQGIERFPVDPAWRVEARFEPPAVDARVMVPSILGTASEESIAGHAIFEHAGTACRMVLLPGSAPDRFFVVFGDGSNGVSTYGGGRFLEGVKTADGRHVVLDFNRAYNPPCVFTPYATCPLPVPDNRLPFAVPAGERMWGDMH